MGTLRISVGSFGLSMLALLSNLGCGGATEAGGANGTGGRRNTAQGGSGGVEEMGGAPVTLRGGGGSGGDSVTTNNVGGMGTAGAAMATCTPNVVTAGFVTCGEGFSHRTIANECPSAIPRATTCGSADAASGCKSDNDCTEMPNGYCTVAMPSPSCYCNYGCTRDSDCMAGQICDCGDPVGRCVASSCKTDADCGGGLCASYDTNPGCGGVAFACTTPADACTGGAQCPGGYCVVGAAGYRVCAAASCMIGRPFLVAGDDRRARITERSDWSESDIGVVLDRVSGEQRARLGRYYSEIAQMEHAAVAAFARLLLELVGHAAPADLIGRVIDAQQDEIQHARLAFGLASELLSSAIGPGPLTLDGARLGTTLEELAYNTVIEGCVGETIAALEAAEARERAVSPELRGLLARITADETKHAQLSWRVVAWLIEAGGTSVRNVVAQAFDDAQAQPDAERKTSLEDEDWGALGSATAAELRRQAWREVITPCRDRLLGQRLNDAMVTQLSGDAAAA